MACLLKYNKEAMESLAFVLEVSVSIVRKSRDLTIN